MTICCCIGQFSNNLDSCCFSSSCRLKLCKSIYLINNHHIFSCVYHDIEQSAGLKGRHTLGLWSSQATTKSMNRKYNFREVLFMLFFLKRPLLSARCILRWCWQRVYAETELFSTTKTLSVARHSWPLEVKQVNDETKKTVSCRVSDDGPFGKGQTSESSMCLWLNITSGAPC